MTGLTSECKDCITEMRGQLYLSAAVYIMKLAQEVLKKISLIYLFIC